MTDIGNWLQDLVVLTNAEAFACNGSRDTCISTSFALCHVLQQLDYNARPLRVEAAVFPDDRKVYGTLLGRPSRQAAEPGMWYGHLAVAIDKEWLLDATGERTARTDGSNVEAYMTDIGNWLQDLVVLTNAEAFACNGSRDTCISTSFALCHVLQQLDYNARPLRVEAAVFPDDRKVYGTLLGRPSRQAAEPGMWYGHLAVAIDKEWLLDATGERTARTDGSNVEAYMTDIGNWLQDLVVLTNAEAFACNGSRDTCISRSFALCHVLQQLDYNARPLRVEAAVFPDDRKVYGTLLGRPSRQAAEPGMWYGHLAVAIDKEWLLDATGERTARTDGSNVEAYMTDIGNWLQDLVVLTNAEAFACNGSRDTCISRSFALCHVLQQLDYNARPLRVEAAVFPDDRKVYGTLLGRPSRQAAEPGMWYGHLAVAIDKEWLLDATGERTARTDGSNVEAYMTDIGNWLQDLVVLTNAEAFACNGSRDTCISRSFALCHVLQQLDYNARPLRVEAAVFPDDRKVYGTLLGRPSRQAAEPGMWYGHSRSRSTKSGCSTPRSIRPTRMSGRPVPMWGRSSSG